MIRPATSRTWPTEPGAPVSSAACSVCTESITQTSGRSASSVARTASRSVSATTGTWSAAPPSRSARSRICAADSSPETYSVARPAAGEVAERHRGQGRLADARRAAEQHQRPGHEAAAEHPVELADPGREPRDPGRTSASVTGLRPGRPRAPAAPRPRRRGRTPRRACSTPRSRGTAPATWRRVAAGGADELGTWRHRTNLGPRADRFAPAGEPSSSLGSLVHGRRERRMEPHRPPRLRRKLRMPRIRTPHGRSPSLRRADRHGRRQLPGAGGRHQAHAEGRHQARAAGRHQALARGGPQPPGAHGGHQRAPEAGGRFPSPVAGSRVPAPEAGGRFPSPVAGTASRRRRSEATHARRALAARRASSRARALPRPAPPAGLPAAAGRLLGQQPGRLARGDRALAADLDATGASCRHRAVGARALRPRACSRRSPSPRSSAPARRGCCPACTSPRRRCSGRSPWPPRAERPSP